MVADIATTPPDEIDIASVSDADPIVPPSFIIISSLNVTIPADDIVIASAAEATPIVPPSLILMSSLNVTIPPEEIVIASFVEATPIVPPSFIIKSSAIVNNPAELNVIFAVALDAAVSETPAVNTNLVGLALAENVFSAIACIPAAIVAPSVPSESPAAISIDPITSSATIASSSDLS